MQLGSLEQHQTYGSEGTRSKRLHEISVHTVLAGLLGFGLSDVAFADGDEVSVLLYSAPPQTKKQKEHVNFIVEVKL